MTTTGQALGKPSRPWAHGPRAENFLQDTSGVLEARVMAVDNVA